MNNSGNRPPLVSTAPFVKMVANDMSIIITKLCHLQGVVTCRLQVTRDIGLGPSHDPITGVAWKEVWHIEHNKQGQPRVHNNRENISDYINVC